MVSRLDSAIKRIQGLKLPSVRVEDRSKEAGKLGGSEDVCKQLAAGVFGPKIVDTF